VWSAEKAAEEASMSASKTEEGSSGAQAGGAKPFDVTDASAERTGNISPATPSGFVAPAAPVPRKAGIDAAAAAAAVAGDGAALSKKESMSGMSTLD
jgi:hypothetical protein